MRAIAIAAVAASLTLLAAMPALAQSGHDLFQQALVKERADGNLRGAIELYERIATEFSADRTLAAKALVQMGECYEKLGSTEAEKAYQRVVREFGDQEEPVAQARTRLAALEREARAADAVSITTRHVRREARGDWLSIVPDGMHAVYTDHGSADLALRDLGTGEIRFLTDDGTWDGPWQYPWAAAVSPDGMRVAYGWWAKEQPSQIRLVSIEGLDPRVLYAEEACSVWPLAWSSDGRDLLANRACESAADGVESFQVVLVSVLDGAARLLKDFGLGPFGGTRVLSPDDRYVVYDVTVEADSGMRDIWTLAVDGSGDVPLVQHPANDRLLGWVPGTDDVVFLSDRNGSWDAWAVLVANGRAQSAPRLLQRNIGEVQPIDFTTDGRLFFKMYTRWWSTSVAPFDAAAQAARASSTGGLSAFSTSRAARSESWAVSSRPAARTGPPTESPFSSTLGTKLAKTKRTTEASTWSTYRAVTSLMCWTCPMVRCGGTGSRPSGPPTARPSYTPSTTRTRRRAASCGGSWHRALSASCTGTRASPRGSSTSPRTAATWCSGSGIRWGAAPHA
jgi:hypothetical protein